MAEPKKKGPKSPTKFTEQVKQEYLDILSKCGLKQKSARAVGIDESTINRYRAAEPEFAERVEQAMADFRDLVNEEVFRRGVVGVEKDVYQMGRYMGKERVYSDGLLTMLARRHDPEFREKQQLDVTHSGGVLVVNESSADEKDWVEKWGGMQTDNAKNVKRG